MPLGKGMQRCSGLYRVEWGQEVEGGNPWTPLSTGEASPAVLYLVLDSQHMRAVGLLERVLYRTTHGCRMHREHVSCGESLRELGLLLLALRRLRGTP